MCAPHAPLLAADKDVVEASDLPLPDLLKFLRKAAGMTQAQLAETLCVRTGTWTLTRNEVGRWEQGRVTPDAWLPALADVLDVDAETLKRACRNARPSTRQLNERMSFVLRNPASADLVAVAYLHERVRQLDGSYDHESSTSLLGPAGQVHGQVRFLREHASNPRVRRALYEVEADSATLMSQLVWDVSQRRDNHAPLAYLDEAVHAARRGRDVTTEAYAVLRKGFLALYGAKDPFKGRQLAEQAATVARFASPSLTGLALLHVAEAHAMTDQLKECEAALRKAETQFDKVDADDVAAPYYTINEYNRLAGSCYLSLGLPQRAEPVLRIAATALAAKKSQAIVLGNLTLALIRQGKLDEAVAAMHRTIDTVQLTRGGGGLNLAFSAGRELRQWRREPWAQEINDRLLALMASI